MKTRLTNFWNKKFGKKKKPDTSPTRINHNPPREHARWMLCGQEIVFHCVHVQSLTIMVSYVLIIHTYLPTYLIVPKCLTNLPTYIVIIYFSYLVITKCFTNSPTYMVTTYLSYHNSYLDK